MQIGMKRIALLTALALAGSATASSPSAWSANDKAAAAACIKASGFLRASVAPTRARFDDRSGVDALLVTGTWPQRHMKGAKGSILCLWTRAAKRAVAVEAEGWTAR